MQPPTDKLRTPIDLGTFLEARDLVRELAVRVLVFRLCLATREVGVTPFGCA